MNGDPFLRGFAFDATDLWRRSTFQSDHDNGVLFRPLAGDPSELELVDDGKFNQKEFQIPEIDGLNGDTPHELEHVESDVASPSATSLDIVHEVETPADIWNLDLDFDRSEELPQIRTWEAFEKKNVENAERTAYLSEAGPDVFDAALKRFQMLDPSYGVLPQDVTLRALCSLAMGRSSIFFQWDPDKQLFVRTLQDVSISGYSLQCCSSFTDQMIDFGSKYRTIAESNYEAVQRNYSCPARVAFRGCVISILDAIEGSIAWQSPHIRSLLQLQRVLEKPQMLLSLLTEFSRAISNCVTDEAIISNLTDQVYSTVSSASCFDEVFETVLARVSAPWLEKLCVDVGMRDGTVVNTSFIPGDDSDGIDNELSVSLGENSSSSDALPTFMRSDDRELIIETKASLRILREHVSTYRLVDEELDSKLRNILSGLQPGLPFETPLARLRPEEGTDKASPQGANDSQVQRPNPASCETNEVGSEPGHLSSEVVSQDYSTELDLPILQPLDPHVEDADQLQLTLNRVLSESSSSQMSDVNILFRSNTVFNPMENLRPLIKAHSNLVNKALMQHLFLKCGLRHHLDLHWQYHLFGNGDFFARLSKALFSSDTQSAERKRGTIPTGETMGLRLGSREGQRWPPASSELRLTLMGVLTETYQSDSCEALDGSKIKELPGGLSFSIRELPESEIERVMNPGSIYALDFLKLQYTAPPPLDAVLTQSSDQAYDTIFRFLVRLLRMLHVTTKLKHQYTINLDIYGRVDNELSTKSKFALEAYHFISILLSHIMDIGIASPWKSFVSNLEATERTLNSEGPDQNEAATIISGLEGLRQSHQACLESIRTRLFLRPKQEKIRHSIEAVFTDILTCASSLEDESNDDFDTCLHSFKASSTKLLDLLRATVDKPARTTEDENDVTRLLLTRLNWNAFYIDPTTS